MERPEIIYLQTPVTINGYKINYSIDGLEYLVDHYKTILQIYIDRKDASPITQFISQLIVNLEFYEHLYNLNDKHL